MCMCVCVCVVCVMEFRRDLPPDTCHMYIRVHLGHSLFARGHCHSQASSLFNSTLESSVGTTYETSPFTFAVRMTKDLQSKAFQGLHVFNGTTLSYTSYFGLQVDIFPL